MRKVITASYVNAWEKVMLEIKETNEEALKHLIKSPPRFWSKSRFITILRCDIMVNNMSEVFNSVFVTTRIKPIVIVIEEIRVYLMLWWESNRQKFSKYEGNTLPNIKRMIAMESQKNQQLDSEVIGEF